MKKMMVMALLVVVAGFSQQTASTTNGVVVVLFGDSTWIPLEYGEKALDDSGGCHISRVAVTEDSNLVLLGHRSWEYLKPDDTVGMQYGEIEMSELPRPTPDEMFKLQYLPRPEYPIGARARGDQGRAIIKAYVDTNGEVISAEILQSSGYMELDQAAIKAARNARFIPAKYRGYPVRVYVRLPITFRLPVAE